MHELSHFPQIGGTSDFAYGQTVASNLASNNPNNAVLNADSIEYFAENTPFMEISAGETTPLQLTEYQSLEPGVSVAGEVAEGETALYQVSGADFVELTTIEGDADLFVFSTPARNELLCSSDSTGTTDTCELSGISTVYIVVVGFTESSFNLVAVPNEVLAVVSEELVLGETLTGTVALDEEHYFSVSGADFIELTSLTGDADLYLFSDAARQNLICIANAFRSESVLDSCEISFDTVYAIVYGFTRSDYTLVAESFDIVSVAPVVAEITEEPAVVLEQSPGVVEEVPVVVTESVTASVTEAPSVQPVVGVEDSATGSSPVAGELDDDNDAVGNPGNGGGGGGSAGIWFILLYLVLLIGRRSSRAMSVVR